MKLMSFRTSYPYIYAVPSVGVVRPVKQLIAVVFPAVDRRKARENRNHSEIRDSVTAAVTLVLVS